MGTTQKKNAELIRLLAGTFQRRYEPNFAMGNAIAHYLALPGLRGFWPCSAHNQAGTLIDLSGTSNHMVVANATPEVGYKWLPTIGLPPLVNYGTNEYHTAVVEGNFDILGNETYVVASQRGLTMGLWMKADVLDASTDYVFCKWEAAAVNRSYAIRLFNTGVLQFNIYDNVGPALTTVTSTVTPDTTNWFFVVGRWTPSTTLDIFVYNTHTTQASAVAQLNNSTAVLALGARSDGGNGFDGQVSMAFICDVALLDAHMFTLYEQTRAMFGI